jgi:hypothetical protein
MASEISSGNCRKCGHMAARGILSFYGGTCSACYREYIAKPLPKIAPQKWKGAGGESRFKHLDPLSPDRLPLFSKPAIPMPNDQPPGEDRFGPPSDEIPEE